LHTIGNLTKVISESYKNILTDIHATTKFGKRRKLPDFLKGLIEELAPASILDFGCGKGNLVETLRESYPDKTIFGYDPANPKYDIELRPVDLIISTDVMKHIEPNLLNETLNEILPNSKYVYHLISCAPAKLILPDGRNAHLIQERPEWWRKKFTDLGYTIIKEDYKEFEKYSKQLKKNLPVKNYTVVLKNEQNLRVT